jgi:hypothetical protein
MDDDDDDDGVDDQDDAFPYDGSESIDTDLDVSATKLMTTMMQMVGSTRMRPSAAPIRRMTPRFLSIPIPT